jgi:hypothetical protein
MKIWKEFGSSHSEHLSIISKFETEEEASNIYALIEDFIFAIWNSKYQNLEEFVNYWKEHGDPNVPYWRITEQDFDLSYDTSPEIRMEGEKIIISDYSDINLGGLIKILLWNNVKNIEIIDKHG